MDDRRLDIIKKVASFYGFSDEKFKNFQFSDQKMRLGWFLDQIQAQSSAKSDDFYRIESFFLDISQNILQNDVQTIRLTDKETALLVVLADAQGVRVSRRQLLDEVWDYAENAETHTLETHIYRLRQKIEHDPSSPEIVLTDEDGYRLGVNP